MRWLFGLVMAALSPAAPSAAQPSEECAPAALSAAPEFRMDLAASACVLTDESRAMTLDDVLSAEASSRFAPVAGGLIDFGYDAGRHWVRVELRNPDAAEGRWWVTHDIPAADELEVRLLRAGEAAPRRLLFLAASDPFQARPIPHRHLVSEVTLAPAEAATLLISYATDQATEMPLFIESVPRFVARTQGETAQIVALTALVLGMGLISTAYLYGLDGPRALIYGAYMLAGVGLLVHMEGYAFQYVWPGAPGFNQVALAFIGPGSIALGILFVDVFTRAAVEAPRLHRAALALIATLAVFAVLSPLLIEFVWFKLAGLAATGLGNVMQVVLAVAAVRRGRPGAGMLLVGFGALAASLTLGIVGYLTEGLFQQELAGAAIRLGFLAEAVAFSAAIVLRIRAARRERDRSLREQLRLSEERLHLSEALRRAEFDRQQAAEAADRSREALASAAHDMRQPLASLRMALSEGDAESDRIAASLRYLDRIVRAELESRSGPLGEGDADPPKAGAPERFRADVVLRNIEAMFGPEAARQGVALRVVPCTAEILADPLVLMRMLGNLVSNAIQHAQAGRVLVGCRRDGATLRFEVRDDGLGLSEDELRSALSRGGKREGSPGEGLGLAIVAELAREGDLDFDLDARPGGGVAARVLAPLASPFASPLSSPGPGPGPGLGPSEVASR